MHEVAVVGAAGYTGVELIRWVTNHPALRLAHVTSTGDAGRRIDELYPSLQGVSDLVFEKPDADRIAECASIAFLAVPHTAALGIAPALMERGLTVVDLSADYRLSDPGVYEQWYGVSHGSSELLSQAVYGLPELNRDKLAGARLIACPGCYPTAAALAAAPALAAGLAKGRRIIVDAKSGVSGAGRGVAAATHYCTAHESLSAYKVASHRHTPEMEQVFSAVAGDDLGVVFTPHLVPMSRGLLATVYIEVDETVTQQAVQELYATHYASEPFVHVLAPGVMPATAYVRGTNRASVGVALDARTSTLIAVCAIDNLGKGAAGQAVQALNAALGIAETAGLDTVGPVV